MCVISRTNDGSSSDSSSSDGDGGSRSSSDDGVGGGATALSVAIEQLERTAKRLRGEAESLERQVKAMRKFL